MIAKITAVEWLVNELKDSIGLKDLYAIEKAHQMEKKQIMDAWVNGGSTLSAKNAKQYYNETFKTK